MKIITKRFLGLIFFATALFTGCAKHDLVKIDESLAPASSLPNPEAVKLSAPIPSGSIARVDIPLAGTDPTVSPLSAQQEKGAVTAQQELQANVQNSELGRELRAIYFGFDSAALDDTARQTLLNNLEVIKRDSQQKVRIAGHCDERGSDDYNLALGERRARAAARYLIALGVEQKRLITISYGNEKPADPGHDETAWAQNRRDEIDFVR